ncbi:unnamed protein product [Paramecium sonneborni]|uniref:Uncharacterized protein n=1 Tax=Paramecium sonneborni TaxID=65129 RepID=A0A8S1N2M1_9CILI|nr:unnamed protein product [Paramecium sonneborni]
MKVQDNSFRLPALRLQPREYKFNLSQESIEQNQSKETIQQNVLNHYNPSPIRHRNKMMSISVYNSQEKIKPSNQTKQFQNSEFITCQNTNNSISVVQTIRRYRSKLKKLVQNKSEINSRDPRYFFFKEPSASIKLNNLQDSSKQVDKLLEERIKQLMNKVQILISSQSFYQQKKYQAHLNVNLVKLQDEYNVLFQDFNEFYFSSKKIDSQIKNLLNHMQIIKKLLSPLQKPYGLCQKSSQSLHQNIFDFIQEEIKESTIQRIDNSQINGRVEKKIHHFNEQNQDDDLYQEDSNSFDEDQQDWDDQNIQNQRESSNKRMKNSKSKGRIKQQGTMDSDQIKDNQDNEIIKFDDQGNQIISPNKRRRKVSQISNNAINIEDQLQEQKDEELKDIFENSLKQTNQKSKIASRRRTVLNGNDQTQSDEEQQSGNDNQMIIQEEELSENEQESEIRILKKKDSIIKKQVQLEHQFNREILIYDQQDEQQNSEDCQSFRQDRFLIQHPNHEMNSVSILDRFIRLDNIYDYKFIQSWNYHLAKIRQAKFLDEFDI